MNHNGFTPDQRQILLRQLRECERKTSPPLLMSLSDDEVEEAYDLEERLLEEYAENLPFVPISRCPFTQEIVEYALDPYGYDGPWWEPKETAQYPEAQGSEHFRVLLGAVDMNGRQPSETKDGDDVLLGPAVPFVIPDLLELPDMQAVLSRLLLPSGDIAYLIAYYSKDPIHGGLLHQPWARDSYEIIDEEGEYVGWGAANSEWDFDLQPWIDQGKVSWIEPGDSTLTLVNSGVCPYVNLSGERRPQILHQGNRVLGELPDGRPLQPFE